MQKNIHELPARGEYFKQKGRLYVLFASKYAEWINDKWSIFLFWEITISTNKNFKDILV